MILGYYCYVDEILFSFLTNHFSSGPVFFMSYFHSVYVVLKAKTASYNVLSLFSFSSGALGLDRS